jgi:hypothetical protein
LGDLSANGGSFSYQSPKNRTGNYFVRFTSKRRWTELAGCYTQGQAGISDRTTSIVLHRVK